MADANGVSDGLAQFEEWYMQAGTPEVVATSAWEQRTGIYSLTLQQACNEPDSSPVSQIAWLKVRKAMEGGAAMDRRTVTTPLLEFTNKAQLPSIVLFTLEGHTDSVTAVRFLHKPDARQLITASTAALLPLPYAPSPLLCSP